MAKSAAMAAPIDELFSTFHRRGWCRFPYDPALMAWVRRALPAARRAVADPSNARWLRCGGTWFVGVNAMPNDDRGALGGGPPLAGKAVSTAAEGLNCRDLPWDRGQVSVCYPGYPRPMAGESRTAFLYRRDRDAAHVDGLLPRGPDRRRHLEEHHAFILGIPMVRADPDASPLVVWEGSHETVREAFLAALGGKPPAAWRDVDVTDAYHAARRRVFERCRRVPLPAAPGEAYLVHRLALHGIAPWRSADGTCRDGRMICYFRPQFGAPARWLEDP